MPESANDAAANAARLQQLTERYCRRHRSGSGREAGPTVEAALMHMMSAMGELSTLAFAASSGISPFEREEVSHLIGKLSLSVAMIAEAFGVDVAHATLHHLEEELHSASASSSPTAGGSRQSNADAAARPLPLDTATTASAAAAAASAPVVLSPSSNERFFRFVDVLATAPPETFREANLKWVAPAPSGALEELIPDGRSITVDYKDFPRYRAKLAEYREACQSHSRQHSSAPSPVPRRASPNAPVATLPANVADAVPHVPGYDPVRESDLYSPSHFNNGLFSPMARVSDGAAMNVYPPAAVTRRESGNGADTEGRIRHSLQGIGRPYDGVDFKEKVRRLRNGVVQGTEVEQLGLTFSVPDGQRVVELVNNGMQVDVTAANAKVFLELLSKYPTAQSPPSERVHRSNSVRQIDVHANIADVPATFSPSHFSHDLFAPFQKPTSSVYVDYDKSDRILPPSLRTHNSNTPAKETQKLYLSAARCADYQTLERIVREVAANAAASAKYGVTFCVPSSLETYSTAEELHTGLHALFPSSSLLPVMPDQQPLFLSLVRQYFPNAV